MGPTGTARTDNVHGEYGAADGCRPCVEPGTEPAVDPPDAGAPIARKGSPMTKSMPVGTNAPGRASIPVRTLRTDKWWRAPLITFLLLSGWVLYAVIRTASQRAYFAAPEHYLSPFDSPCVSASCPDGAQDFGVWFGHSPPFFPLALITLPFLLGFR